MWVFDDEKVGVLEPFVAGADKSLVSSFPNAEAGI